MPFLPRLVPKVAFEGDARNAKEYKIRQSILNVGPPSGPPPPLFNAARSKRGPGPLQEFYAAEHDARRRLVRAQRRFEQIAPAEAVKKVKHGNVMAARQVRHETHELSGRGLVHTLAHIEPATDAELDKLANALHARSMDIFIGIDQNRQTDGLWWKLYQHMDKDRSGLISYSEVLDMVREQLGLSPTEMPEVKVQAGWKAIDTNESGYITCGEFGKFMRRAEAPHNAKVRKRLDAAKARLANGGGAAAAAAAPAAAGGSGDGGFVPKPPSPRDESSSRRRSRAGSEAPRAPRPRVAHSTPFGAFAVERLQGELSAATSSLESDALKMEKKLAAITTHAVVSFEMALGSDAPTRRGGQGSPPQANRGSPVNHMSNTSPPPTISKVPPQLR